MKNDKVTYRYLTDTYHTRPKAEILPENVSRNLNIVHIICIIYTNDQTLIRYFTTNIFLI